MRSNIKTVWLSIALASAGIVGALAAGSPSYHDAKAGFTIATVAGWELKAGRDLPGGASMFMMAPEHHGFHATINVQIQSVGAMTLAQYTDITKKQLDQAHATVVKSTLISASHQAAECVVYKVAMHNNPMEFYQIYLIAHQKAYVLTGTAPQSDFVHDEPVFVQTLNSFRLDKP